MCLFCLQPAVPTLAYEILSYNAKNSPAIPLVGLAVGDPCTDNDSQSDSMDAIWYSHKYGLLDDDGRYNTIFVFGC